MEKEKIYEIQKLMQFINKTINQNFKCHVDFKKFNPSIMTIMMKLTNGPPKTLNELSKDVGLANSTVSGIIDKLVDQGFVMRIVDENDRRKILISLTEKALEKKEEIEKIYEERVGSLINNASDEDIEIIIKGLNKFVDILKGSDNK